MGKPRTYCTVTGCERKHAGLGMCSMHYRRMRNHGTTDKPLRSRAPFINPANGYVYEFVDGKRQAQLQHRLVMATKLGRPLEPNELVHHRNGIRHDNAEDNLELWVRWQPQGARVADLVEFAKAILTKYEH
jgi:hypothetical protein